MSKKDFVQGVSTAVKANEAFMRKQETAIEELGKRVIQKIDEHGQIIDVILDALNTQEKKELYNLQSEYDIADLGENEKEVLASYLLTLIAKYGQDTENQKAYYLAVKKHMKVTDVSADFDLSLVENVDSRAELKAMLQTVCEFLFLKTGDFSFLETFEEEISAFGLSRKVLMEAITPIETIYNALGIRGILEHYIPAEMEEIDPEHYGLVASLEEEIDTSEVDCDVEEGEEDTFENIRLLITDQLVLKGRASFINCQIVFDVDITCAIFMGESAKVEFINCEFITNAQTSLAMIFADGKLSFRNCSFNNLSYRHGTKDDVRNMKGELMEERNCAFIVMTGYEDTERECLFEHCIISNCEGSFIGAGNDGYNFRMEIVDCLVENHTGNFLYAISADGTNKTGVFIHKTTFQKASLLEIEGKWSVWTDIFKSLISIESSTLICTESVFENINENVFHIPFNHGFNSESYQLIKCKLKNFIQDEAIPGVIDECEFSGTKNMDFGDCGEFLNNVVTVRNSLFSNFDGRISLSYGKMEHCDILDSTVQIIILGKPNGQDRYKSEGTNLRFVNCKAFESNGYLPSTCFLQAASYLDKPGECVWFNGCKFENCKTNDKYVNVNLKKWGAFQSIKEITVGREFSTVVK